MTEKRLSCCDEEGSIATADRLANDILDLANRGLPRVEFLTLIAHRLIERSDCDAIEIWVEEEDSCARFIASRRPQRAELLEIVPCHRRIPSHESSPTGLLCFKPGCPNATTHDQLAGRDDRDQSTALMPLYIGESTIGWLRLQSFQRRLSQSQVDSIRRISKTLGIALVNQRAQAALGERVKELTCLYKLSQLSETPGIALSELLQGVAELLPLAWQYPEIAVGRITFAERSYASVTNPTVVSRQSAAIKIGGVECGKVEVIYTEERARLDEGPFLKEERNLIDAIAREIAVIIERRQTTEERNRLREQLLHADRLATIGQLAAGVAHELNEPLGAVLGFAQLAKSGTSLADETSKDIGKIEAAALHAREIVKKLMIFARQTPPRKDEVDLNQLVEDSLYFLESRCARKRIEVIRRLAPDLPAITADPSQLQQVLVNLVVNAIQSMDDGGRLTLTTELQGERVQLRVKDSGYGMSEEIRSQIFLPFFTTKDVNRGTGLGLAVAHGIVNAHGGRISVDSEPGVGSCFAVDLPVSGPAEAAPERSEVVDG
jgi:signal transduction histidine kinase